MTQIITLYLLVSTCNMIGFFPSRLFDLIVEHNAISKRNRYKRKELGKSEWTTLFVAQRGFLRTAVRKDDFDISLHFR